MNEKTSSQMMDMVERVRERARRAESEYDSAANEVQRLASGSISLFGGTATSQVADIAAKAKMACDKLYADYQSLVLLLDDECRPLLQADPSLAAVKAVMDLITWLNNESKIENNFSASVNSYDLGDVASRRYTPSVNAMAIQSFWETKYDMFPGRREEEARLRAEQQAARAKAEAERHAKEEEERRKFEAEHAEWQAQHDSIAAQRAKLVEERMETESRALAEDVETKYRRATEDATSREQEYVARREEEEKKLAGLGFFAFGAKKQCRAAIEQYSQLISKAQADAYAAHSRYQQDQKELPTRIAERKSAVEKEVAQAIPMPSEPRKPFSTAGMTAVQMANSGIKQSILEAMEDGKIRTITELMEDCPECQDLSNQRVSALVRQLVNEGRLQRIDKDRKVYFCIVQEEEPSPVANNRYTPAPKQDLGPIGNMNQSIKEQILESVRGNGWMTLTEIMENCPACAEISNQRASALIRQLVNEGELERSEMDRKAYFKTLD